MVTPAAVEALLIKQRHEMDTIAGTYSRRVERSVVDAQSRIVQAVIRHQGPVTTGSRVQALQAAERIVEEVGKASLDVSVKALPDIIAAGAARTRKLIRLLVARGSNLDRIVDTYMAFERSIETQRALVLGSTKMQAFMDQYTVDWVKGWSGTIQGLQSKFTQASASGLDWRVVARAIVSDAGELVVPGAIDPETFATMFARTKVTEIDNLTARAIGAEAGLSLYVNLGVPDDAQSEECYDATNADAMTLEDWSAAYEEPPRHPNCRCLLLAVPEDPGFSVVNPKIDRIRAARKAA